VACSLDAESAPATCLWAPTIPTLIARDFRASPELDLTQLYKFYKIENMKATEVITGLAALAHESRLSVFRLLVKRGPDGYTPTELADKLDVPGPTLSFHLKELQRAGLIEARRQGRFLYYRPRFPHMNALIGFLTENCCILSDKECSTSCEISVAEVTQPKRKRA
jgi:ArsR family transcriptional regulator, arsenate/arsenite/antimonite-responsive transcriptional repressor